MFYYVICCGNPYRVVAIVTDERIAKHFTEKWNDGNEYYYHEVYLEDGEDKSE